MRNLLYSEIGKKIEILVAYNPKFQYLGEWWKQLYGESEGKVDLPEFVLTEAGEVVQPVPMAIWPAVDAGDVRQRGKTWLFPPVVRCV